MLTTTRGVGVELWGTFDDLSDLYEVIGQFWNSDKFKHLKGYANKDELISGFSYEIRHAYQGDRLKRKCSHFSSEFIQYYGVQFSWVHIMFSLAALKYNMQHVVYTKFHLAMFLKLEFWLEKSMKQFDAQGAQALLPFLEGAIYPANEYLYQYMRAINFEHVLLGGGKKAFRQLPVLMRRSAYGSKTYNDYRQFLMLEAERLKCEIDDLELSDNHFDYTAMKW